MIEKNLRLLAAALAALTALAAPAARAEDVGELLRAGPLVRIETGSDGKLRQATCIADVEAPVETVWKVLNDFESYRFFMPRIQKLEVTREGPESLVAFKLDTPIVSTSYTLRYTPDHDKKTLSVKQVKGDLAGSRYSWRVVPAGEGRARIYYSGLIKNFSSLAESFEDDQQTLSIGINVVSLMASAKAVKARAEQLQRQAAAAPAASPAGG
jgi:carbon monoxide dehydrogenase subunit G